MTIATYSIQQWLFSDARGRYDIDLAESGVQFQKLADLSLDPEWGLDYSADRGIPELRAAVARLYGPGDPAGDRVIVTHGAQEALYLLYRSLLSAGDHVVTTSPGWQQSWEVPRHMGCDVTVIPWRPGTPFDTEALARAVGPRTRVLVLNSPGNPSGCVLGPQEWEVVLDIARAHDLWVVNDEEYLLDFTGSVVARHPRAVSVSSLSKVYGLPALRLGWATGPAELIERMVNYKRYTTVSNSVVWERAATRVLAERERNVERYRSLVGPGLDRIREFAAAAGPRVRLVEPAGTPFAWLDTDLPVTSRALAERLLERERVLVMPAEVFGAESGLRVSFARPADVLDEGLDRLGKVIADAG